MFYVCFVILRKISSSCLSQATSGDTDNVVLLSSSSPPRQPGPEAEVLGGGGREHHTWVLCKFTPSLQLPQGLEQVLTRLFGVNVLQCVNIEIIVLVSPPMLTAQQGNSSCCLYLCKLSRIKPSRKTHRQKSSFCNGDVCLFVII